MVITPHDRLRLCSSGVMVESIPKSQRSITVIKGPIFIALQDSSPVDGLAPRPPPEISTDLTYTLILSRQHWSGIHILGDENGRFHDR